MSTTKGESLPSLTLFDRHVVRADRRLFDSFDATWFKTHGQTVRDAVA
jgi:hypothetical protein